MAKKRVQEILQKNKQFKSILSKQTHDYSGQYSALIRLAPEIFDALIRLSDDETLSVDEKDMVVATIGYFVLDDDIYPEEVFGPIGFLDDILASLHLLKTFGKRKGSDYIRGLFDLDEDIFDALFTTTYDELKSRFPKVFKLLLNELHLYKD